MKSAVKWIVIVIIAIPIIAFAVANRQVVTLSLDPLALSDPQWVLQLPLFLLFLIAIATGILIGGGAAWLNQRKWRKAAHDARYEADHWRGETQKLEREIAALGADDIAGDDSANSLPPPPRLAP